MSGDPRTIPAAERSGADNAAVDRVESEGRVEPRSRWHDGWPWWAQGLAIDLRSLAVFRVALGAVMLGDLIDRARDLRVFYTDEGVLPSALHPEIYGPFAYLSVHRYAMGSAWLQGAVFVLAGLAAVALVAGWRARLMAGLAWGLTMSLHQASPDTGAGGDGLLRILLFWAMLVPIGARWSVDARRDPRAREASNSYLAIPGAALLLQIAMVYWFTAAMKSGQTWRDGSALGVALWNDYLTTPAGAAVRGWTGLIPLMTYGTLALEWLGPVLALSSVWRGSPAAKISGWGPWCGARLVAIGLFAAFHIGIEITMTVGLFTFASLAAWTVFIPACVWDRLGTRGQGSEIRGQGSGVKAPDGARGMPLPSSHWTNMVAAAVLGYVLLVNVSQLPGLGRLHFFPLSHLGHALMLDQRWSMFAPDPRDQYGWLVFQGRLADGRRVDLFRGGREVRWEKPASVSGEFPSMRWRVYLMNLGIQEARHVARLEPLARYLAREWNAAHSGGERLDRLALYVVIVDYRAPGAAPRPLLMCEYDAAKDRVVYVLPVARPRP